MLKAGVAPPLWLLTPLLAPCVVAHDIDHIYVDGMGLHLGTVDVAKISNFSSHMC
jgi:hypothetical protein